MSKYSLGGIIISSSEIGQKVTEIAGRISKDYSGRELVMVGILKGAFIFLSDLVRKLDMPVSVDFIGASSYGDATESSGNIRITKDLDKSISGKHVLLVEDIIDTGLTLQFLKEELMRRSPAGLEICALLEKKECLKVPLHAKYVGFSIPDVFVVGYGLDCGERWRCLPDIWSVETVNS